MLHVSTAYSNCNIRGVVEEMIYPSQVDWKEVVEISEKLDPVVLNILTEKYVIYIF